MRHVKAETLLKLAMLLQGGGLTLDEMAERLEVGRRTAERMRDALERLFPALEAETEADGHKHWRLPKGTVNGLVGISADELAALETARELCAARNMTEQAGTLAGIADTLRALATPAALSRAEPDLEALLEAEGLAMAPGPRPVIDPAILADLRGAILAGRTVRLRYRSRITGKTSDQPLHPYGFLYGPRHYLVAFSENTDGLRLFALDGVQRVDLMDQCFARDPAFSLEAYAAQSFGVFQEAPQDIALRFAPHRADEAAQWRFHPSQSTERVADGALIVRFTAGGLTEIAWHLFTWGKDVTILAPAALQERYHALLTEAAQTTENHETKGE